MLRNTFNALVQYAEDARYGLMLPGKSTAGKVMDLAAYYIFIAVGTAGALIPNPGLFFVGAYMGIAGISKFSSEGRAVRESLEVRPLSYDA